MAQDRDLLDQLARPYPSELGRFDRTVKAGCECHEPRPLGGEGRRLCGAVLARRCAKFFDLRANGGKLGAQRFGGLGGIIEDRLDVDPQAAQLFLDFGEVLDRLFGGLDGGREPRHIVGELSGQLRLSRRRLRAFGGGGLRLIGRRRLRRDRAKRKGRDEQRGEQDEALRERGYALHSLTAWPKLRGWRVNTGADGSAAIMVAGGA